LGDGISNKSGFYQANESRFACGGSDRRRDKVRREDNGPGGEGSKDLPSSVSTIRVGVHVGEGGWQSSGVMLEGKRGCKSYNSFITEVRGDGIPSTSVISLEK
jgi:hypothetical protein